MEKKGREYDRMLLAEAEACHWEWVVSHPFEEGEYDSLKFPSPFFTGRREIKKKIKKENREGKRRERKKRREERRRKKEREGEEKRKRIEERKRERRERREEEEAGGEKGKEIEDIARDVFRKCELYSRRDASSSCIPLIEGLGEKLKAYFPQRWEGNSYLVGRKFIRIHILCLLENMEKKKKCQKRIRRIKELRELLEEFGGEEEDDEEEEEEEQEEEEEEEQ